MMMNILFLIYNLYSMQGQLIILMLLLQLSQLVKIYLYIFFIYLNLFIQLYNCNLIKFMNKQQQIQTHQQIQQYLQNNNIYPLFTTIIQKIILQRPTNILDHIINQLQSSQKFTLFIIGPPGLSISPIIKNILTDNHLISQKYQLLNCGQQISKNLKELSSQDKNNFNSLLLINNDKFIKSIIDKISQKIQSQNSNIVVEGFPKNLEQALLLQGKNIYMKNVLFVNVDLGGLYHLIYNKIKKINEGKNQEEIQRLTRNSMTQYTVYTNQLKKFYKGFMEIDLSAGLQEQSIKKELTKAFNIKTIRPLPIKNSQIIIIGAPLSGRTTLGKNIAKHYNFIYISTSFLISQQIRKDTIHGRKIKSQYINNQMIDNFLIQKLIQERIALKDCKMQGFVLQGYPKNKEQYDNIKNMKLQPTMIVAIDTPIDHSRGRNISQQSNFQIRYNKWNDFATYLHGSKDNIFWINPYLNVLNMQEEVVYQFQKSFK